MVDETESAPDGDDDDYKNMSLVANDTAFQPMGISIIS